MSYFKTVIDTVREIRSKSKPVDLTNRDVLIANLSFVYQIILAGEDLLKNAADYSVNNESLHLYFCKRMEQQRGLAQMLADDLQTVGVEVDHILKSKTAVAMAGGQYYLIRHFDPSAFLGFIAAMEGVPMPLDFLELLEKLHGTALVRTLRFNAERDGSQFLALLAMIDNYSGSADIMAVAVQTALYLNEFSDELAMIHGHHSSNNDIASSAHTAIPLGTKPTYH